jgi:hypothetical protein
MSDIVRKQNKKNSNAHKSAHMPVCFWM